MANIKTVGIALMGASVWFTAAAAVEAGGQEQAVVERFRERLERAPLSELQRAELSGLDGRALVHAGLCRLSAAYAAASAAPDALAENLAWAAIIEAAPGGFVEAEARYRRARLLLADDDYEGAVEAFEELSDRFAESSIRGAESLLFQAYGYGRLDERGRARRLLTSLLSERADCPERYREAAHWFMSELKGRGTGPLLELSKSMEGIRRLIRRGETGSDPTQGRQQAVVDEIERLIALMENKNKGKGDCKKCKGKGCRSCQKPGGKPGSKPGGQPLPNSQLPGGSSDAGQLERDKGRGDGESWGALKDAEREQVLQLYKERFPARYRELLEQYYRSLNRSEAKPRATREEDR
jgi:tetratricopeptide (TPR) repeat protein